MKRADKYVDEPTMSDTTVLMKLEDIIDMAMGPPDKNVINYKLIQTVLLILARQLRMLEQQVEIRILERPPSLPKKEKISTKAKRDKGQESEEKAAAKDKEKAERALSKERDKEAKASAREKEKAESAKAKEEKAAAKDKQRADREASKERERKEKEVDKEKDKAERAASKEREKEERAASKERDKEERAASKERDKAGRAASKEREKEERAASKEREKSEKEKVKAEKTAEKEKEKTEKEKEKMSKLTEKEREKMEKEKEKAEKAAAKEAEKLEKERQKTDKLSAKEREKQEKEQEKAEKAREKEKAEKEAAKAKKQKEPAVEPVIETGKGKGKGKKGVMSATSIAISEVSRGKDKVLVVEKGPTTRADTRTRVGSIQVVTVSQFEMLENAVKELAAKTAPLPMPTLPDNQKLRSDIAKGSASLTDTMQAMQVTARVRAAEEAITRMGDLLTQLAAAGALPEDVASQVEAGLQESMAAAAEAVAAAEAAAPASAPAAESRTLARASGHPSVRPSMMARKSVAIDPQSMRQIAKPSTIGRPSMVSATSRVSSLGRQSVASSRSSTAPKVTHKEMDEELRAMRAALASTIQTLTTKATAAAEVAAATARGVAEKLDVAVKLDARISNLHSLTTDYAEQLSGFDAGLTSQMQSFQEQMGQMRADLKGGLTLLETVNNNAETAAVLELTERYEGLVTELEHTSHAHHGLTAFQKQLGDELRSLVECVETLREQKADRDEVQDGLRDKADISRLAGLLRDEDFVQSRKELERRLNMCYDKFQRQDLVWTTALKDLSTLTEGKAELMQLLTLKDNTQDQLRDLQEQLRVLAEILGEPKAAILTRKLARDATCGVCAAPALMHPTEQTFGQPAALPPVPVMPPRPLCLLDVRPDLNAKPHACHRWVGGSHTLLAGGTTREPAPPLPQAAVPSRRYVGVGTDGQLYMLEEELQPCEECNRFLGDQAPDTKITLPPPTPEEGAGDIRIQMSQINKDEK